MTIAEMLMVLVTCNQMIEEQGLIGYEAAKTCSYNYKNLKNEVADGDFVEYRKWYDENAEKIIQDYLNSQPS